MTKMTVRAIDALLAEPWAILPETLDLMASIAERENEYHGNLTALEAKLGRPLGNTMRASVRDGVALVPVEGPLFRRANLMTEFSGATSYNMLAKDFTVAVEDPAVKSIVLMIDSPGGMVNGASEFAGMVKAARGKKPIVAYIGGTGASAAYWIASAADRIVAADTALIGSVGAQSGFRVPAAKAGEKEYRFVSSQSPLKNADPDTEAGAKGYQAIVDDLASVFISTLAENRSTTTDKIMSDYGQGAVFVAAEALKRGMIDGVSSLEATISSLINEVKTMDYSSLTAETLAEKRPDLVKAISDTAAARASKEAREAGATAERERILAIEALAMPGAESIIAEAKTDPSATAEKTAIKVLAAVRAGVTAAAAVPATTPAATALANIVNTEASFTAPAPIQAPQAETAVSDIEKGRAEIEALRKIGVIQ